MSYRLSTLVLFLAAIVLAGCGGSASRLDGGGGSTNIPGAGRDLTSSELAQTETALRNIAEQTLDPDNAADGSELRSQLLAFIERARTAPNVVHASADGPALTGLVVLSDGLVVNVVHNRITSFDAVDPGRGIPEATRTAVPDGRSAYVFEPVNEPGPDEVAAMLRERGYTVTHGRGSLAAYQSMSDAAFFFYNGHGTFARPLLRLTQDQSGNLLPVFGDPEWAMSIEEFSDINTLVAAHRSDVYSGRMYLSIVGKGKIQLFVGANTIAGWNMKGAIAVLNSCLSASPAAEGDKIPQAFTQAGALALVGFSNVSGIRQTQAAADLLGLTLGEGVAKDEEPALRPFSMNVAYEEMRRRSRTIWTEASGFDDEGNSTLLPQTTEMVLYQLGTQVQGAPHVSLLTTVPQTDGSHRIQLAGDFGNNQPTVRLGGITLSVVNHSSTSISAILPDSGPGRGGELVVEDKGLKSHERFLTVWDAKLQYEIMYGQGSLAHKFTLPFTLRLDVQGNRKSPNDNWVRPAVTAYLSRTDEGTLTGSGEYADDAATIRYHGSSPVSPMPFTVAESMMEGTFDGTSTRDGVDGRYFVFAETDESEPGLLVNKITGRLVFWAIGQVSATTTSEAGSQTFPSVANMLPMASGGVGVRGLSLTVPFEIDGDSFVLKGKSFEQDLDTISATVRLEQTEATFPPHRSATRSR